MGRNDRLTLSRRRIGVAMFPVSELPLHIPGRMGF